ncbi:hypothetical protein IKX73_00880 [Candidatus Saccharibacteria bacterium]|nr:hypothetical protein [Candidatus Saccharibacteria bacterium]
MGNSSSFQVKERVSRAFDIIDGPNRYALFEACLHAAANDPVIVPVTFDVVEGYDAPPSEPGAWAMLLKCNSFRVLGIENEDGSGESWNIHGYCQSAAFGQLQDCKFEAYYNSKRRKGSIRFRRN